SADRERIPRNPGARSPARSGGAVSRWASYPGQRWTAHQGGRQTLRVRLVGADGQGQAPVAPRVRGRSRRMTAMPIFKASDVVRSTVSASRPPLSVAIYMHDLTGGGVERQSLGLAREFLNRGICVTLVLHRHSGELSNIVPKGLPIIDLNSSRTIADVPPLVRYLRAARPDVLLANVDHNNIAALMARALAGGRTRVVICQHNPVAHDRLSNQNWTYRLVPYAYFLLSPFISRAVAVSGGVGAELMSIAGLPRAK